MKPDVRWEEKRKSGLSSYISKTKKDKKNLYWHLSKDVTYNLNQIFV